MYTYYIYIYSSQLKITWWLDEEAAGGPFRARTAPSLSTPTEEEEFTGLPNRPVDEGLTLIGVVSRNDFV